MNTSRFLMAVVVVFGFIFAFEWGVHGYLLMDDYQATADLWRPIEAHEAYMQYMLLSQLAQAFMIVYIFTRNYEGRGVEEGVRYGLYIGLLLAALDLGAYCYLPVEFSLIASWMGASLFKGLGAGIIASVVYKN